MPYFKPDILQIQDTPVLTALHMTAVSLDLLDDALLATHPELMDIVNAISDRPLSQPCFMADAIRRLADGTRAAINAYRAITTNEFKCHNSPTDCDF